MHSHIIFDLDGTLVDSTPGIVSSLESAFHINNMSSIVPFASVPIGPPLRETLRHMTPHSDDDCISLLESSFKSHYDLVGYKNTRPYQGISDLLHGLLLEGFTLHIATNKRYGPALNIINLFGWDKYFTNILSPDSYDLSFKSKSEILAFLLDTIGANPSDCVYVGDRLDDYTSAQKLKIPFILAAWGMGSSELKIPSVVPRLTTVNNSNFLYCASQYLN